MFNHIFTGESEYAILWVVDWLQRGRPVPSVIPPWTIPDLDRLPYPDRAALGRNHGGKVLLDQRGLSTVIMGSRGCPYNCAFCASEGMWGRKVRWRNVDDLINEIKSVVSEFGIRNFRFSDDNMTSNRPRLLEFCDKVKELDIHWRASVRVDSIDVTLLEAMKGSGCEDLSIGAESFDVEVLRAMNKHIVPDQTIEAVWRIADAGINARVLMMISTPGETYRNTVTKNIEYIEKIRGHMRSISMKTLVPLPGTTLWTAPELFNISVIDRSLEHFNFYMYERDKDGNPVETPIYSNIMIDGMTRRQQLDNIRAMREYISSLEQNNTGVM